VSAGRWDRTCQDGGQGDTRDASAALSRANAALQDWAQVQLAAACRSAYESGRALVLPAGCLGLLVGCAVGLALAALFA
jgi:threonine dehydrogenase-like Zn-dependent dehydrogenase